jgi:hypothetical protein
MPKPPTEPPQFVTTSGAFHLLGVSRGRFDQWRTAGLISAAWFNGNRPMYSRADVLALPDRLSQKPPAPLMPPEDRVLARERAGEPDFVGIFAERFESLVPGLGELEARTRAIAHAIRAYRKYHECDFRTARIAVTALIESLAAGQPPASEPGP